MTADLLAFLRTTLEEVGQRLVEWRDTAPQAGRWEGTQLKAEADLRAHDLLAGRLAQAWAGIPVVSEEDVGGQAGDRPARYWLIDPIDGTASYCGGYPGFVTQAALMEGGRPVASTVHAPALGLTWAARMGGGASLNGSPLPRLIPRAGGRLTLIDNYPEPRGIAGAVYEGLCFASYVESGSLGLKICRVADGTADLFVKDVTVRDWDLAPGDLILSEVGGVLVTLDGSPVTYSGEYDRPGLIASTPALADRLIKWCAAQGAER